MFNFSWFKSSARKRLEEENAVLKAELERRTNPPIHATETAAAKRIEQPEKPYKNVFFNNNIITVVLQNGLVLSKDGVDKAFLNNVLSCLSEAAITNLFIRTKDTEEILAENEEKQNEDVKVVATEEEKAIIDSTSPILKETGDFEFKQDGIYLKDVNLRIPELVLASFIEFTEKGEKAEYEALKMFWLWTSLNPIESSRNDLLNFVQKNDIIITSQGLLETYRKIQKKAGDETNKKLVEFISEQYLKVKRNKKSPKNFSVDSTVNGYELAKSGDAGSVGNLANLYANLSTMKENVYTDGHTKSKVIRLGTIYREDESKIDLNNRIACSSGLHVGSKSFGFDGFGDTGVMALVNPMKVRSVPRHATNKMRVSEMFIVGVMDEQEYKRSSQDGVNDFSQEYFKASVNELVANVKGKTFDNLNCQNHSPALSLSDVERVSELLKTRIVKI